MKYFSLFLLGILLFTEGYAQTDAVIHPDSVILSSYTRWDESKLYANEHQAHTALKPILHIDTTAQKTEGRSWIHRKIFNEHLLVFQKAQFHLFVDFLPDFQVGSSSRKTTTPWQNTRGFRIAGNIGKKVYFETEDFETQQAFPGYIDSQTRKQGTIPRLDNFRKLPSNGKGVFDFNYASARLIYLPVSWLQLDLGYGKNFIGDGYRSMLLSDWSFNYPYLKATGQWRNFQYTVMWSQYLNTQISQKDKKFFSFPKKWAQTYFLDWHFNKNGNIGIFESVLWPDQNKDHRKDINWTLLSPVIFMHGNQSPSGTENFTLTGLNAKYKILPRIFVYGQIAASNFLKNSNWSDRFATQIGIRGSDVFGLQNLDFIVEYNQAKPYMYAGKDSGMHYTHFNQPLADPLGAAFQEGLAVITYRYDKWWFRLEGMAAKYYWDTDKSQNGGGDIFKPLPAAGAEVGGGQKATLYWGDFRAAYIINPKNNLRVEAGITLRKNRTGAGFFQDRVFMIGLRSSFRDLINDF